MANILINKNGKLEYLRSVNTGDYVEDPSKTKDKIKPLKDHYINPDVSAVEGVPIKYWKLDNGSVVEMTSAEKKTLDDAEIAKIKEEKKKFNISTKELAEALISLGVVTRADLESEVSK